MAPHIKTWPNWWPWRSVQLSPHAKVIYNTAPASPQLPLIKKATPNTAAGRSPVSIFLICRYQLGYKCILADG